MMMQQQSVSLIFEITWRARRDQNQRASSTAALSVRLLMNGTCWRKSRRAGFGVKEGGGGRVGGWTVQSNNKEVNQSSFFNAEHGSL